MDSPQLRFDNVNAFVAKFKIGSSYTEAKEYLHLQYMLASHEIDKALATHNVGELRKTGNVKTLAAEAYALQTAFEATSSTVVPIEVSQIVDAVGFAIRHFNSVAKRVAKKIHGEIVATERQKDKQQKRLLKLAS